MEGGADPSDTRRRRDGCELSLFKELSGKRLQEDAALVFFSEVGCLLCVGRSRRVFVAMERPPAPRGR